MHLGLGIKEAAMSFFARTALGLRAAETSWKQTQEPSPVGKLLITHKHTHPNLSIFSWHAGKQSKLQKQIDQGRFDNIGEHIYFGRPQIAAHFGGREKDSVLLEIAGTEKTPTERNEAFNTTYFPAGKDQEVYILSAYTVSKTWQKYAQKPPTFLERTIDARSSFSRAFEEEPVDFQEPLSYKGVHKALVVGLFLFAFLMEKSYDLISWSKKSHKIKSWGSILEQSLQDMASSKKILSTL